MKRKSVADVEVDHRELEDEHDVDSRPPQIQFHDVQDAVYDHVHPDWKPDVENEDDVADEVVEYEVVDVPFDVIDEVRERLADVHDVDRDDFLQRSEASRVGRT